MANSQNKFADVLAYLALRLVAMFVHMFDWRAAYRLCGRLGDVWCRLDGRHRRRAAEHLRPGFPDWSDEQVQQAVRGSFRNLIYLGLEVLLTTCLIKNYRWRKHVVLHGHQEAFRLLVRRDAGLLLIAGHFGGWEVAGYTMAALGFTGYAVARPLDNPYLNKYLLGVREHMGLKILDKTGAAAEMAEILKNKQYLCFIADQDAGQRGVFVDFFGRKASSYRAPALIAVRSNVPVVVAFARRMGEQFRFEIGVERILYPHEWADKSDPVFYITQEYTAALERIVRKDPSQYLWIYRRWKTRPKDETPAAAATA